MKSQLTGRTAPKMRRPPHGGRGLKFWRCIIFGLLKNVAPRTGGVG